jgi:hypothetical protein
MMRASVFFGVFALACGGGETNVPNEAALGEFADFDKWGSGYADFSAPTSAGGAGTSEEDDTGSTTEPVGDSGACMSEAWDDCVEVSEEECEDMGWLYYGDFSCEDFMGT